jgi:hypothetical protein
MDDISMIAVQDAAALLEQAHQALSERRIEDSLEAFFSAEAAADWRWMLERTDSPRYPGMRIFRQPLPGDWYSVIDSVARELDRRCECSR